MSWSVSAFGKAQAVAAAIERQFTNSDICLEPEETIRQGVRGVIKTSLSAMGDKVVRVDASGSMSNSINSASMKIEPLYNFVE